MKAAHRLIFEECIGPIPDGLYVLHRCDNKRCVNPEHLFLRTNQDNQRDAVLKGRHRWGEFASEKNPNRKLTMEQVEEIRRVAKKGLYSKIARRYGVAHQTIRQIARGEAWKHSYQIP